MQRIVINARVILAPAVSVPEAGTSERFSCRSPKTGRFLSVPLAILPNMCSVRKVHRTARIALRTTPARRRRCYGLLRSAGDVWAWVIDRNRGLAKQHRPQVANFAALCRELTGTSFGELSRQCAEAVLKNYSIAFFEAARRQKEGIRAGFPRRKRGLVPVRFRYGCFSLDGSRVRLRVARGAPEMWVRLGRAVPYPVESIRSVTLVAEAGRLFLDVTAEVPVAGGDPDPTRVAGIDLGIIHPYAAMAGDDGLLVSGRQIRAEERLHLEDTKRRQQRAAPKAPSKGQRGSRRWRRYRASRREPRPVTAAGSARPTTRQPDPWWPGWWSTRWAPSSSGIPGASRPGTAATARTWHSATGGVPTSLPACRTSRSWRGSRWCS
jgi:hypothetical protein